MKELLEFYNNSSDNLKRFIEYNCDTYFDPKEPDGYKKCKAKNMSLEDLIENQDANISSEYEVRLLYHVLNTASYDQVKDLLMNSHNKTESYYQKYIDIHRNDFLLYLKSDDLRAQQTMAIMRREYNKDKKLLDPTFWFLLNKDFTEKGRNELFSKLVDYENREGTLMRCIYNPEIWIEMFGTENIKEYLKRDPLRLAVYNYINDTSFNDIFDELFFCENGWTDDQKKSLIDNISVNCIKDFEKFVEKILSVDKYYIKYLPNIFRYDLPMLNSLATLKKPDEEITEDMNTEQKYRFDKQFRLLLKACYACMTKKEIGKSRMNQLKEVGPLLKFYNRDFDTISQVLYPEIAV